MNIKVRIVLEVKDDYNINHVEMVYCKMDDLIESPFVLSDWADDEGYKIINIKAKDLYTGLNDKNDKEIYEGDIVEDWGFYGYNKRKGKSKRFGKVIWYDKGGQIGFIIESTRKDKIREWSNEMGDWWNWNELKIIGNIYENPELVE